ncbi:MAG: type I-E CRISPR-associated protein Cas6/Cse3/CasE [Asticcacaulis sp.]
METELREVMVSLPAGILRQPQLFHAAIYHAFANEGRPRDFLFKGLQLAAEVAIVRARRFRDGLADMARPIIYAADRDVYDFHLTAAPQYRDQATQKLRFLPIDDDRMGHHLAWLRRKAAECGFTTQGDIALERRIVSVPQKGHMAIDNCEFSGTLRVTDRPRFEAALERGIGPRAGYGYGLLSLY